VGALSLTSQAIASPLISAATSAAALVLTSRMATLAPAAARMRAVAGPEPGAPAAREARRGASGPPPPAGDESRLSTNIHDQLACAVGRRPGRSALAGDDGE